MKRFRFRLESVLRLKRQFDRQAEVRQQQARGNWEAAQREVEELVERLVQGAAAVEARIGTVNETDCWIARYQHMTQVRAALDLAESHAQRAKNLLDEANRLRRKTAADLEALLQLRREQWRQHRHESALAEQNALDDVYLQRGSVPQLTGSP
jgi:flagellar FliJ protein